MFHHINAFEKDGKIYLDACCYHDDSVIRQAYLSNLRAPVQPGQKKFDLSASAWRTGRCERGERPPQGRGRARLHFAVPGDGFTENQLRGEQWQTVQVCGNIF